MQKAEVYQLVQFQARNQTSFRNEWLLCVYIYIYVYQDAWLKRLDHQNPTISNQ